VFTLLPMLTGEGRAHHGDILREATRLIEAGKLAPRVDPDVSRCRALARRIGRSKATMPPARSWSTSTGEPCRILINNKA
jgi:hypothetical protein